MPDDTTQGFHPEPLDAGALDRIRAALGGGGEPTAAELAAALEQRLAAEAAEAAAAELAGLEPAMRWGDGLLTAYHAQRKAQADARAARAEAGRAAQAENGLDNAALAAFLALPKNMQAEAYRESAEEQGLVPRDNLRWRLARAVASPAAAAAMDAAMKQGELPDETPSLLQAWGQGGRSDLIAALLPGARPAAEVAAEERKAESLRDERGRFRSAIFGVTHGGPQQARIAALEAEVARLKQGASTTDRVDRYDPAPEPPRQANSILTQAQRDLVLRRGH